MGEVKNYLADLTVLFVDDEDGVREAFEELLGIWCKKAYSASNGKEGFEVYKKYNPDIIVTDIKMPVMTGLEMIGEIKKLNPDFPIIITTAFQEPEFLLEAIELHVDGYIVKPIAKKELKKRLETIAKVFLLEKELEKVNKMNQLYLNASSALMVALDINGNITMLNKAGREILGINEEEIIGKNWFEIGVVPQEKLEEVKTHFFKLISGDMDPSEKKVENELISKNDTHHICAWADTLLDENGEIIGVLSSGLDITQKYFLEQKLIAQTYIDELTNLHNRKSYNKKLEESLSLHQRYNTPFSILMYDIDDFKRVNDNYGHDIGDKVLMEMSALVQSETRKNDYLFRIGGEEFVVICSGTNLEEAKTIAQKLREKVEKALFTEENLKLTISIGLTEVLQNDTSNSIFKRVDTRLYESKKHGKNMVSY